LLIEGTVLGGVLGSNDVIAEVAADTIEIHLLITTAAAAIVARLSFTTIRGGRGGRGQGLGAMPHDHKSIEAQRRI
jgi:hypothetical protein